MSLDLGDCRVTLARWAAEGARVQCVVTRPPYWGLRDYGTDPLVWGGDAACPHEWASEERTMPGGGYSASSTLSGFTSQDTKGRQMDGGVSVASDTCLRCSAWRGSLGLEPTPELYVAHLVEIFRLVRDVLADDGTVWLNLGDSYNSSPSNQQSGASIVEKSGAPYTKTATRTIRDAPGLKPKDLCMIPARVALALQADGWWLRSDIIWAKPNPMPESVTDRPTKAHEYLFLLTKRATYHYDAEAIKEPVVRQWSPEPPQTLAERDVTRQHVPRNTPMRASSHGWGDPESGRNRRSVWTIATTPFPGSHFAVMPEDLVKPCILAGSRPGDVVLDPFMGSGTVAQVAQDLGRRWLGCEMSEAYAPMSEKRTRQQGLAL